MWNKFGSMVLTVCILDISLIVATSMQIGTARNEPYWKRSLCVTAEIETALSSPKNLAQNERSYVVTLED